MNCYAKQANFDKVEPFKVKRLVYHLNDFQERSQQLTPAPTIHTLDTKTYKERFESSAFTLSFRGFAVHMHLL